MNTNTKSVSKVNAFFNKLKKYNSHNIIIYSNQENSLRDAILSDGRSNKVSKIDGELITVKPNIKVENFPYTGGIKHFEGSFSKNDDPIIKRIKENGGIVIGFASRKFLTIPIRKYVLPVALSPASAVILFAGSPP